MSILIIYLIGVYFAGVALHCHVEDREDFPISIKALCLAGSWVTVITRIITELIPPRDLSYFDFESTDTWWPGNWFPTSRHFVLKEGGWFFISLGLSMWASLRILHFADNKINFMFYGVSLLLALSGLCSVLRKAIGLPRWVYLMLWTIVVTAVSINTLKAQSTFTLDQWCKNEAWYEWSYNRPEAQLCVALPCLLNHNYGCENRDTAQPIYVLVPVADSFVNWEPESRVEPYHALDYTSTPPQWASKFYRSRGEFYLDFGSVDMAVSTLYFPLIIAYDGNVEWTFYWGANGKNEWFQGGDGGNMLTYQHFNGITPQEVIEELLCAALQPYE